MRGEEGQNQDTSGQLAQAFIHVYFILPFFYPFENKCRQCTFLQTTGILCNFSFAYVPFSFFMSGLYSLVRLGAGMKKTLGYERLCLDLEGLFRSPRTRLDIVLRSP